jgi:hypothetical protein
MTDIPTTKNVKTRKARSKTFYRLLDLSRSPGQM